MISKMKINKPINTLPQQKIFAMKKTILLIPVLIFTHSIFASPKTSLNNSDKIAETTYFDFRSNYVLNLHHFLLKKASAFGRMKKESQKQFDSLFTEIKTPVDEKMKPMVMAAIKYYADSLAGKNMLFDPEMTSLKYLMESCQNLEDLTSKNISTDLNLALTQASEFYSQYLWNEQDKLNREFISTRLDDIKKIENDVIRNSSKYYQYKYNGVKFRIDMVDYATFFGAYTTTEPYISAVISSTYKSHSGSQGIEVIFHEASHGMIDSVFLTQQTICKDKNLEFDHNIWHTILFYSTGMFVKNELQKQNIDHEIYIYKNKLGDINPSVKKTIESVAENWQLYLDDKTTMNEAISQILLSGK